MRTPLLLLAAFSLSCLAQDAASKPNPENEAFAAAGREKEPLRKLELWESFLKEFPKSNRAESARREIIQTQFKLDPAEAGDRVERFEKETGAFAAAALWRLLAEEYLSAGKEFDKAEAAARRALDNYTFEAYLTDARRESEERKRPMQTEGRLRYSFDTTRVTMMETLGQALAKQQKDKESIKVMREALDLNRSASKAALSLARTLDKQGQAAEALPYAAQGLLARPSREAMEVYQALFAKVRPGSGDPDAYLDETYRRVFPPPMHAEPYAKPADRSDRVVLVEVYTGAGCPPCVAADLAFDAALERYSRNDVAVVMFHEHIPRPDPMTNADTIARWKWLEGKGVPTSSIDGQTRIGGGPREYAAELEMQNRKVIDHRLTVPADATLRLTAEYKGPAVLVRAAASGLRKQSADLVLHIALAEKLIRYSGENGIRFHPMVVRSHAQFPLNDSAEPAREHTFDLAQVAASLKQHLDDFEKHDERHNKDGKFRFMARPETIDASNLAVVAWLQDKTTREVYQAAYADAAGAAANNQTAQAPAGPAGGPQAAAAPNDTAREKNPVQWKLSVPGAVAGTAFKASLRAIIAPGWHLYSLKELEGGPIPTRITVPDGQSFRLAGPIEAPPPIRKQDETFGMEVESYEESVDFTIPVTAAGAAGSRTLKAEVRFQVCDDKLCLPPRTIRLEAPVQLTQ